MEYFFKKKNPDFEITKELPCIKESNEPYTPYNEISKEEKDVRFTLTSKEIELIDNYAKNHNISYSRALNTIFHDSLALYTEVMHTFDRFHKHSK
jgi:hypothetical protein